MCCVCENVYWIAGATGIGEPEAGVTASCVSCGCWEREPWPPGTVERARNPESSLQPRCKRSLLHVAWVPLTQTVSCLAFSRKI